MKEHSIDLTIEMLEVLHILWDKDNINQQGGWHLLVKSINRKLSQ